MIEDLDQLISSWRNLIKNGRGSEVGAAISKLSIKKIQRRHREAVANIARRVSSPNLAIRILHPVIRPVIGNSDASATEFAEYAASLSAIGAHSEAQAILDSLDWSAHPMAELFSAFSDIFQWDYASADKKISHYLGTENDPYKKLVGQVNLIAAKINLGKFFDAEQTLQEVLDFSQKNELVLLHGNALELSAQIAIEQNQIAKADSFLSKSYELLKNTKNASLVFTHKWRAVLEMITSGDTEKISEVEKICLVNNDWESLRDLHLRQAIHFKNEKALEKVFFGSPFEPYRDYIRKKCPFWIPPGSANLILNRGQIREPLSRSESEYLLDVSDCRFSISDTKTAALNPHHLPGRALKILCSDLYHPFSLGNLFSKLFPGDFFDPATSPDRIYQVLKRLRGWLSKNFNQLKIHQGESGYFIDSPNNSVTLIVGDEFLKKSHEKPKELALVSQLQDKAPNVFSSKEAAKILKLPLRTTNRFIREALEDGSLEKIGRGPQTKYKVS